jgi:hypothetical protein
VNSEELELSLRTEFESYLKNVLADMKQEVSEFQKQFEAEYEKHKAQLDDVFQNFSTRVAADKEFDAGFSESVLEHLRLSRDEGARITATAIAEAEEMEKQNAAQVVAAPSVGIGEIRDAINDISTKTTQSAILKTLVNHAGQFTSRGAFFIIKNEHLVGWRVFGEEGENTDEQTVREVFFPVAASTVLGESVRSLTAVESSYGTYSDDSIYLNKLEFGQPERMFAVPLVVRGRSVAVLYADGENVNVEALETLVRVASLTVEILASARGTQAEPAEPAAEETPASYNNFAETAPVQTETSENYSQFEQPATAASFEETAPVAQESYAFTETYSPAVEEEKTAEPEVAEFEAAETEETVEETPSEEVPTYETSAEEDYSYQPIQQPAETLEEPDYHTPIESDSFSFRPSVETKTAPSEFVSETSNEVVEEVSAPETEEVAEVSMQDETEEFQPVTEHAQTFEPAPAWSQTVETEDYYSSKESPVEYETPTQYEISEPQTFETESPVAENEYAPSLSGSDYQFETSQSFETPKTEFEEIQPAFETPSYEAPQFEAESYVPSTNGKSFESFEAETEKVESYIAEPVEVETVTESFVKQPVKSRFNERNVDLPIEVSEDERRLHNDARRFARLLVSEIKLYNEQKVKEGREGNDLYERLREAIDRSREMYDKRVQPPVAAKFDYFNYELVSNLAEGDENKLGASYPGASS